MEKLTSEMEEKLHGNKVISFAFSLMASLFAFFHSGQSSNAQKGGTKENTERMGK
jgi:hypothetical protein